jgi:tetratricopeptide (TPR) repeat protein
MQRSSRSSYLKLSIGLVALMCVLVLSWRPLLAAAYLNLGTIALSRALVGDEPVESQMAQLALSEHWLHLAEGADGANARALRAKGVIFYHQEEYQSARDAYEGALAIDPADRQTRNSLALTYRALDMPREAEREWLQAGVLGLMLDRIIAQGAVSAQEGDFASAEASYLLAVDIAPSSPRGYYALAGLYWGSDLAKAQQALEEALERDHSPSFERYWAQGRLYILQGEWERALEPLRLAVNLQPTHFWARIHFATALWQAGAWAECVQQMQEAIALDPENAYAHSLFGEIYRQKGRLAEAILEFQRCVRIEPANVSCHVALADTYRDNGQIDEALAEYRTALEMDPALIHAKQEIEKLLNSQPKD